MILTEKANTGATVGSIVAQNFRTADVFRKHGIDFCCRGGKTIAEACAEKKIGTDELMAELIGTMEEGVSADRDYKTLSPDDLIVHILDVHHAYVRENIPHLMAYLEKIKKVHGTNHPELVEVYQEFSECARELTHHMLKEENVLFPAIRKLWTAAGKGEKLTDGFFFGTLDNPVSLMKQEHEIEGDRFVRLAHLTNHYMPPDDACTTYKVAFKKLEDFQNDLFTHIHLENNILFPKAIELESSMTKN